MKEKEKDKVPCTSALGSGIYSDSTSSPPSLWPPPLKTLEDAEGGVGGGPALVVRFVCIVGGWVRGLVDWFRSMIRGLSFRLWHSLGVDRFSSVWSSMDSFVHLHS